MGKCKNSSKGALAVQERNVDANTLREEGLIQYFYHSPSSELPIRDVLNELGAGHKTEPHIEIGAENFMSSCYQANIKKFANSKAQYIFLTTTCRNRSLKGFYNEQFIVGYIVKEKVCDFGDRICVRGKTYIFSFKDSLLVKELFGKRFSRSPNKGKNLSLNKFSDVFVGVEITSKILNHFQNKENILRSCIEEIERLDKLNPNDKKTCKVLKGEECIFQNDCIRIKLMNK